MNSLSIKNVDECFLLPKFDSSLPVTIKIFSILKPKMFLSHVKLQKLKFELIRVFFANKRREGRKEGFES